MTVGPTVWPSSLVSTPCELEGIDQGAPARLDLGLVDRLLRRTDEVVGRRQHPLATLRAGAELQLGLLDQTRIDGARRWQRARRPRLAWLGVVRPVVVERGVVQRRRGDLARSLAIALQASTCCRTRSRALRPIGMATAPTPRPVFDTSDRSDPPVSSSAPPMPAATKHDDGPTGGEQAAQRLADQGADPSAGPSQCVEMGHDLVGSANDVQQPEQRQSQQPPPDRQPEGVRAATLADQGNADRDQRRWARRTDRVPVSQPTTVSTPRPSGPARSTYIASPSSTPTAMKPIPANSCSRPSIALTEFGRRLVATRHRATYRPLAAGFASRALARSSSSTASWVVPTSS